MNALKVYTIDDLNKLKGWERQEALANWRKHDRECWKEARKEMRYLINKISFFKYRKQGKCFCSRQLKEGYSRCEVCLARDKNRRQRHQK